MDILVKIGELRAPDTKDWESGLIDAAEKEVLDRLVGITRQIFSLNELLMAAVSISLDRNIFLCAEI